MIPRQLFPAFTTALAESPAVALLGPRQTGKTTLALEVAGSRPSIYLDPESGADRAKLAEPELYLAQHADKLVILDEIQRTPQLFQSLRGLIDAGRRRGQGKGRFLVLGPASIDLLKQSSESLAGRTRYLDLLVDLLLVHALLGIEGREALLSHPVSGGSWEGLAIESLIAAAPSGSEAYFFRTAAGAEIDLLLKLPGQREPWAIEIKRGLAPKIERGFHNGCEAVRPRRRHVVYGGVERFPLADGVEAVSLPDLCEELAAI